MSRGRALASTSLLVAVLSGCAGPAGEPTAELVDAATIATGVEVDMRYAGPDNFVGAALDGYGAPRCLLAGPAAEALARAQRAAEREGLGLRVFDCYRPQRAVDHFVRWAGAPDDPQSKRRYYPNVDKSRLFAEGYIADRSGHSRAATVDVTLVRAGIPLDMGTPFDFFDPASHTEAPTATDEQGERRRLLRRLMESAGFENYPKEWWHYTLRDEPWPDRYWDVPIE